MKRFSIFLLFLIVGCALNAQDDYRNYVLSRTMLNGTGTSYLDNITYYDGLGRPFQTVQKAVQRQAKTAVQVKLAVKMAAQKAGAQQHLIHLPKTKVLRLLMS